MNDIKSTVTEQLQQLQMLMHRYSFHGFMAEGRTRDPFRGQGRVLAIMKMKPEISQRELTFLLGMSKQSIAELLAKLERAGLITRETSSEDKRILTVKLTDEGRKAVEDVGEDTPDLLDCLNDDEFTALSGYLERIIRRYEEQFPDEDFDYRRQMMEAFRHGHDWHNRRGFGRFDERR